MLGEYGLRRLPVPESGSRVPQTVVIGTQVFDAFLDQNDLRSFALDCADDAEIVRRFEEVPLPEEVERDLTAFLERAHWPLAGTSSKSHPRGLPAAAVHGRL